MSLKTKHGVSHGRIGAATTGGGLIHPECEQILREFYRFNTEDARAAFADNWIRITARQMEVTWPVLYTLLQIVRDRRLYENSSYMADRKARTSFEEYWEQVVEKPFDTWAELEANYRFASASSPDLLTKTFSEVSATRAKTAAAAKKTTGDVLPRGGDQKSEQAREARSIADSAIDRQPARAEKNGVSYDTQRKLDRLAREFPALHARVAAGELSVNRAYIEAGLAVPTFSIPLDPKAAARRIMKRFSGEQLVELIRELAQHVAAVD